MIMEWHVSISCTPFKLLDQTHKPRGPTLEPWTGGQIQPQTLKGSVTGNTDLDNYILPSRVAPYTNDADVHALCTKPAVLKMEESGKSSMHLIMRIENAFKFCGKLIHFYNERISFLFYCEDGKRGAVS
jgi:hypothetical protein